MPLKVIDKETPPEIGPLVLCVSGLPGLGKTTTGLAFEDPLHLDFDKGAARAGRKSDRVVPSNWSEVEAITADDVAEYDAIVIDTVGRAVDLIIESITDPSLVKNGAPSQRGWGVVKRTYAQWMKRLRTFGKDIVLICHVQEEKDGDQTKERLDIQGGTKGEIYKSADIMGSLFIERGERWLSLDPTDRAFGKNPGGLDRVRVELSDGLVAKRIIDASREAMGKLTEEQQAVIEAYDAFVDKALSTTTCKGFTELAMESNDLPDSVRTKAKLILIDAARKQGAEWKAEAKKFMKAKEPADEVANESE